MICIIGFVVRGFYGSFFISGLFQQLHHFIIIPWYMREDTVDTALHHPPVLFLHLIIPRALSVVQRTVTEQAVNFIKTLMTWIVFALLIGEELT